jgi:transposase
MGAPKKGDWREARRRQAWELKQRGWKQKAIAQALGVSEGAVSQWLSRAEKGGAEALASHPPPGPKARLSASQKEALKQLLSQGAQAHGFRGDVWTSTRVCSLIARHFGVQYHADHVRKILREMGLSYQQPTQRASQRDEEKIAAWARQEWPRIKKG